MTDPDGQPAAPGPSFAHASEAELARILDFYDVRWEYEPHTFPILWNLDGAVVESFSPDFFLPDLDLYVELTTLKQTLVRKKNRKLRRLRELYPGIRVKLFYARDFRQLMLKFGKLALVDELSGTSGQVVPAAAIAARAVEAAAIAGLAPSPGAAAEPGATDAVAVTPDPPPLEVAPLGSPDDDDARRDSRRQARRRRRRRCIAAQLARPPIR